MKNVKIVLYYLLLVMLVTAGQTPAMAADTPSDSLSISRAVALALENNPAMQEAAENMEAARAASASARADLFPQASFHYGYTGMSEAPIMKQMGQELQVGHENQYDWDVTVVQPLFTGFALSSRLDIAKLEVEAKRLEKEQVALDLTQNVKNACHGWLLARRLLAVAQDEVAALESHERNAELFSQQGLIRPNDLLQAKVALADSVQRKETAAAALEKARILINRLVNRPLDAPLTIQEAAPPSSAPPDFDMEALGVAALKDRPLMKLLDTGLSKLNQSMRLAKSAWYPTVSVMGQYERSGGDLAADENDYSNAYNSVLAVKAEWKFFQSGKTLAETRQVKRKIRSFNAAVEGHKTRILQEVRTAVLDCRLAKSNIGTAEKALAHANENWRITDLQYKEQVATSTDVLDARAFLTQADTNYFRALYGFLDALAALDRAVGRGVEN